MFIACSNRKGVAIKSELYDLSVSEKNTDSLNPKHKPLVHLINSLVQQELGQYRNITFIQSINQRGDTVYLLGWIKSERDDSLSCISMFGNEYKLAQSHIVKIKKLKVGRDILTQISTIYSNPGKIKNYQADIIIYNRVPDIRQLILASWLYQRNEYKLLNDLMDSLPTINIDKKELKDYVGYIYFQYLLDAFSVDREFETAKRYADYFDAPAFQGFEYRATALRIGNQIKEGKILYDTYPFPDSLKWAEMKTAMSRAKQFDYLTGKLNLLNYVQLGQPGGISYNMPQTRIPYLKMFKDTTIKEDKDLERYYVINPFEEIIKLKPTKAELIQLSALLDDSTFIPAYSYFRDFFPDRTVHQVNWVVAELINQVEHRRFWGEFELYNSTQQEIDHKIGKLKKWIKTLN